MRLIDYLFFKLYKTALKTSLSDMPVFAGAAYTSCLISLNIIEVLVLLSKLDIIPSLKLLGPYIAYFMLLSLSLVLIYFFKNQRYDQIVKKYSTESDHSRRAGNAYVRLYVIITIIVIFVLAFFRRGKI